MITIDAATETEQGVEIVWKVELPQHVTASGLTVPASTGFVHDFHAKSGVVA